MIMRRTHRTNSFLICMAVACVAAVQFGAASLAQPGGGPPRGDQDRGGQRFDGENLRERLEARLAETRREEAALQNALEALDRGEPAPQVVRGLMRDPREQRGFGDRDAQDRSIDPAELTPERREQILNFLRETAPPLAERVERELRENPDQADRIYGRLAQRVIPEIELRERDPEMFEIRLQSMRLDWRIRQAAFRSRNNQDGEGRDALLALVRERVDLTIRERAMMLDRFEKRIERMREELDAEMSRRDEIVAEKVDELERGVAGEPPPPGGESGPRRGERRGQPQR